MFGDSCIRAGFMNMVNNCSETGVLLMPHVSPRAAISFAASSGLRRLWILFKLLNASSRHQMPVSRLSDCAYEKTLAVAQLSGEVTLVRWLEHQPSALPPGATGICVELA